MEAPVIRDAIVLIMTTLYFFLKNWDISSRVLFETPFYMSVTHTIWKGMCNTVSLSYHMSFLEALQYMH